MIVYKLAAPAVDAAKRGYAATVNGDAQPSPWYPTTGIVDLPGILGSAASWLICKELWPDRADPLSDRVEVHFAICADHSFAAMDDITGTVREPGIFAGTLFAQAPGPLTWLRPNSAYSWEYVGLRWLVPRENLPEEMKRIAASLGDLAGTAAQFITIT